MKLFNHIALLVSFALSIHGAGSGATPPSSSISFQKVLTTLQNDQTALAALGVASLAAGYIGYAIYLDCTINKKESLWHWTAHHIKDGTIDPVELLAYIQTRYSVLQAIHPLTAIFAAAHATQNEIDICLNLRAMLNTLKRCKLSGLISETSFNLDKKLENLYLLKIALANCTAETRSRCKKKAFTA